VFLSDYRFEQRVPSALLPPGTKSWRVVELSLRVPWYIAALRDPLEQCSRELMLAYEADLVDLIESSRDSIKAIHRVVPPRNGHAEWVIEPVTSVWRLTDPYVSGCSVWLFEGAHGGQTYWPRVAGQVSDEASRELVMCLSRD
jgi:hypothetical protein